MLNSILTFLKSPLGLLSTLGNALAIGNFQNDYLPQLVKWGEFFLGVFAIIEKVGAFFLVPIEWVIQVLFRLPDWGFPPSLSSYVVLNFVLLGFFIG